MGRSALPASKISEVELDARQNAGISIGQKNCAMISCIKQVADRSTLQVLLVAWDNVNEMQIRLYHESPGTDGIQFITVTAHQQDVLARFAGII